MVCFFFSVEVEIHALFVIFKMVVGGGAEFRARRWGAAKFRVNGDTKSPPPLYDK